MAKIRPSSLVAPLGDAAKASRKAPLDDLHESTLLKRLKGISDDAHLADMADEAREVEERIRRLRRSIGIFDFMEDQLLRRLPGLRGMAALRSAVARAGSARFHRIFSNITEADLEYLFEQAIRNMLRSDIPTPARKSNMGGHVREVVAQYLPGVLRKEEATRAAVRARAAGSGEYSFMDSTVHKAVELPTLKKAGNREIRLGTDRVMGLAHADPRLVQAAAEGQKGGLVQVMGTLELAVAVEIKGATTAGEGVIQLRHLQSRGTQGYAVIGRELWLLEYDPRKVVHLLVAPEGAEMERARSLLRRMRADGIPAEAVEIAREIDAQIMQFADALLHAAREYFGSR
jgi:hypothetical protein